MKILHIVNGYFMSSVHAELFQRLDDAGIEQVVYDVMRKSEKCRVGENKFDGKHIEFIYEPILGYRHKVMFFSKKRDALKNLLSHVDMNVIDVIHASTSNSDGAVALELHKRYGIPYIVMVRNTDLDIHGRMPHLWIMHRTVLKNAYKVVCITPLLKNRLLSHPSMVGVKSVLKEKTVVIHNGINAFWLSNSEMKNRFGNNILYVGKFDRNKNVLRLVEAVRQLRSEFPDLRLDMVGGDGANHKKILECVKQNSEWLSYLGKIFDKDKLKSIYLAHSVFAMVSLRETFGLVYIEAMSQGLKVLYSKGQGIDGLFSEKIGEGVSAKSVEDIKTGMRKLLTNNYDVLSQEHLNCFDWNLISKEYIRIYKEMMK